MGGNRKGEVEGRWDSGGGRQGEEGEWEEGIEGKRRDGEGEG